MTYQVKLEVFEGPFDLLLQLIARRRLDITEIDLADITADFLGHLGGQLETFDLETATRFLVIAATLVELKAARLLPSEERDEVEDLLADARDLLYARLLEYRAFRDVARLVENRLDRFAASRGRDVAPESWIVRLVPDTPLPVDATGLAALAAAATAPRADPSVDLGHIRRTYLTIRDAARQVLDALPAPGEQTSFADIARARDRSDRVVMFLALLELFKLGHVGLEQPHHRRPLLVGRLEGGHDLDALIDADEELVVTSPESDEVTTPDVEQDRRHDDVGETSAGGESRAEPVDATARQMRLA
ncbi:MAG: ScpA family protein [Nitriliruptoraceae bacterium]